MSFAQVQTLNAAGFVPDLTETEPACHHEIGQIAEPRRTNPFYEGLLLAFSFIFLFLGLLPPHAEPPFQSRSS